MSDKLLTRAASIAAGSSTLNVEARTVEVCWTTGAAVKRYSWDDGYYMEELAVTAKAIRMDRFNAMSLLDGHEPTMDARLGTVVPGSVRIEGGKAFATLRLSRHESAERILQDLQDGHPLSISVGYRVHKSEKTEGERGQLPTLRAIDWEPLELSAVAVPADPAATSRKDPAMPEPIESAENEQRSFKKSNLITERKRQKDIRDLGAMTRGVITEGEIERALDGGTDIEELRTLYFERMVERQSATPTFPVVATQGMGGGTYDDPAFFRASAVEALLGRMRGTELSPAARGVFADGEAAFARRCLERSGKDVRGWSDQSVLRAYVTTSDFALITGDVANLRIVDFYKESVSQLGLVFGKRDVTDFNVHTEAFVDWTTLQFGKVNEHGEYRSSFVDEGGETIQVSTWGGIVGLSRQLVINAAGVLDSMSQMQGRALAGYVNKQLSDFIQQSGMAGPKMRDGKTVFHADRGNIVELDISSPAATAMDLMTKRAEMAQRKGRGDFIIGAYPKYWIVHPKYEGRAIQALASVQASAVADVNPVAGRLTIISDARLTSETTSWLVADPKEMEGPVRVYLNGNESPYTEAEVGFEIDGVKYKIRLDHGLGWLEWRSWTRLDHVIPEAPAA
ncbi:phage major capsid protein [Brucella grignonensis]|nr:hypothetical protein [Brucella grignonensis]NKB83762.1 hypothetical protein [Brucella grignonensis]